MSTKYTDIQEIVLRHSARGMDKLTGFLPRDSYGRVAERLRSLPRGSAILIATGFDVGGAAETDGPPGAYAVANALMRLGYEVTIVVPEICRGFFEGECFGVEYVKVKDEVKRYRELLDKHSPKALISIECLGMDTEGEYCNFRGKNIASITAKMDILFRLASDDELYTVGIGDGGNEIGMGRLREEIKRHIGIKPCGIDTTDLLVATTSNWGAYGLAKSLEGILDYDDLFAFTKKIVAFGAVDGITKQEEPTVDGFSVDVDQEIVEAIANLW